MYSNEPHNYLCPFCLLAANIVHPKVQSQPSDIIYRDQEVMALICAKQWPHNQGHVLIIPVEHYENIYTLPLHLAARIHELSREVSLAMKERYGCDGISTRQHNEPSGQQEVWHYHLHVFPRYRDDRLYAIPDGQLLAVADRARYANLLRPHFQEWHPRPT